MSEQQPQVQITLPAKFIEEIQMLAITECAFDSLMQDEDLDDTFESGIQSGRVYLAREMLKQINEAG